MNILINGVEVDSNNTCLEDYKYFSTLSPIELERLEKANYAELRELRNELDVLLNELRQQIGAVQLKCA